MEDLTLGTVYKNGTSLVISLPRGMCKALMIERGDQVIISTARGGFITLRKLTEKEKLQVIKY